MAFTYPDRGPARQIIIQKLIKKHETINQKQLLSEYNAEPGHHISEMTLQNELRQMAATNQINAKRMGRETIYSLPSTNEFLRGVENSLMNAIEIRRHVYNLMVKHWENPGYPPISKIRYLQGNLKFIFNDLNQLMMLDALNGKKGLYKKEEDTLRATLRDMLSLAAKDKDAGEVLPVVVSSVLDPRSLLRSPYMAQE